MPDIIQITDAASYSTFTKEAEWQGKPTVTYVSNSVLPACKTFTPKYENLVSHYGSKYDITFGQIDYTSDTSMLFKFSPNQLPVLALMCRESEKGSGNMWAKTIMGADLKALESGIAEMLEKAGILDRS
jgi:thiol-disulfide isomerase/thioredoxin